MEERILEQISKVLAGEATSEEKDNLRRLLSESDEYSLLFSRIKEYWEADVTLKNGWEYAGLENSIIAKLRRPAAGSDTKFRRIYRWAASAAAAVFLISTCFLLYKNIADPGYYIIYAAQSSPADYILSDGTRVRLNRNSSLTVRNNYARRNREVRLDGEGYFMVTKDASRTFIVNAADTKTSVMGTDFNVKVGADVVTVTLVEGSVRFTADQCDVLLSPGHEVLYSTLSKQYDSYQTDTQFNTAWVSGRFVYDSISFGELMSKLEAIYGIKITVTDERIASRIIYASFLCEEPVEKILMAMEMELQFNFSPAGSGDIVISAK